MASSMPGFFVCDAGKNLIVFNINAIEITALISED